MWILFETVSSLCIPKEPAEKKMVFKKNVVCKRVMNYFDFIASFEPNVSL